jgi:isopentenyl phosphate kinase
MQPSASAVARAGVIQRMALEPITAAVEHSIIPVVYGDVALDEVLGGTIVSTETVLTYLAQNLPVDRIVLAGDVPGVLDEGGAVIPLITPASVDRYKPVLGGSGGTDVTGGMLTKVTDMVALVNRFPALEVNIVDGTQSGVLTAALTCKRVGTLIRAG